MRVLGSGGKEEKGKEGREGGSERKATEERDRRKSGVEMRKGGEGREARERWRPTTQHAGCGRTFVVFFKVVDSVFDVVNERPAERCNLCRQVPFPWRWVITAAGQDKEVP